MTDQQSKREPTPAEIARWEAESRKFDAEAAEAAAHAAREAVETRRATAEAVAAEATAAVAEIELDRFSYGRSMELASNEFHGVYWFHGMVSAESVAKCIDSLSRWHRIDEANQDAIEPRPFKIVFNSPGGDIVNGMALYDFILQIRQYGHHVTTEALGMAASMAGILLQSGDTRVMARQSWLLIHEASFAAVGSFGEVKDRMRWVDAVQNRILDIFADRCAQAGENGTATKPLTRKQLAKEWERTDFWISAEEALEWGLIDEVKTQP